MRKLINNGARHQQRLKLTFGLDIACGDVGWWGSAGAPVGSAEARRDIRLGTPF